MAHNNKHLSSHSGSGVWGPSQVPPTRGLSQADVQVAGVVVVSRLPQGGCGRTQFLVAVGLKARVPCHVRLSTGRLTAWPLAACRGNEGGRAGGQPERSPHLCNLIPEVTFSPPAVT